MATQPGIKSKLSKAVIALIISGAGASAILGQFLDEKEGNRLTAYQDGVGAGLFAAAQPVLMAVLFTRE